MSSSSGLLGCGNVFYAEVDNEGVKGSWLRFGNATKFEIKENTKLEERSSRGCDNYGAPLDSVVIREASDVAVSLDEINRKNLATAFLGTSEAVTIASGSEAGEVHVVTDVEGLVKLSKGNITNVVVTVSSVAMVLGDDYTIEDAGNGIIGVVEGGSIVVGTTLSVAYDYAASSYDKVVGGTDANKRIALMLIGKNMANGKGMTVIIHKTTVSPTSSVDFLSDTFTTIDLSGKANLDTSGQTYEVTYNSATT